MELPKRKKTRLQEYDYSKKGAYFITICTQNKLHLFDESVGATLCGRPNFIGHPEIIIGESVGATLCGRPNSIGRPNFISRPKMIEKWLLEIPNKYDTVLIDKYVIMPNHIHCIMILTGDHTGSPLPTIIDWYKTMTTNEYIKEVRKGQYPPFDKRIWQRSYHDHIIRNKEEYQKIWEYIDTNPLKWEEDCFYEENSKIKN